MAGYGRKALAENRPPKSDSSCIFRQSTSRAAAYWLGTLEQRMASNWATLWRNRRTLSNPSLWILRRVSERDLKSIREDAPECGFKLAALLTPTCLLA
jgi:hypothetical protein